MNIVDYRDSHLRIRAHLYALYLMRDSILFRGMMHDIIMLIIVIIATVLFGYYRKLIIIIESHLR